MRKERKKERTLIEIFHFVASSINLAQNDHALEFSSNDNNIPQFLLYFYLESERREKEEGRKKKEGEKKNCFLLERKSDSNQKKGK